MSYNLWGVSDISANTEEVVHHDQTTFHLQFLGDQLWHRRGGTVSSDWIYWKPSMSKEYSPPRWKPGISLLHHKSLDLQSGTMWLWGQAAHVCSQLYTLTWKTVFLKKSLEKSCSRQGTKKRYWILHFMSRTLKLYYPLIQLGICIMLFEGASTAHVASWCHPSQILAMYSICI